MCKTVSGNLHVNANGDNVSVDVDGETFANIDLFLDIVAAQFRDDIFGAADDLTSGRTLSDRQSAICSVFAYLLAMSDQIAGREPMTVDEADYIVNSPQPTERPSQTRHLSVVSDPKTSDVTGYGLYL